MSDDAVRFSRKPYTITYRDLKGDLKSIRRVPPARQHDMLPTDIVSLTRKKNDDFDEGDEFEVAHIAPRHPNVLQLRNEDGQTTFVDYYDARLEEEVAWRDGRDPRDKPANNRYLSWP